MSFREAKITEAIKNLAASFLQRESNSTSLITVTNVQLSDDLKTAKIFITVLPESAEESALEFTKRKRSDFRDFIKESLRIRQIPFFDFQIDLGEKTRQKIDEISKSINN
ncbi:ribosome-binding factor A [Candidatus Nomurabacteria bacterium]|nr:ribosome-binding factor A [Candidatus Nomurabacteria bacterium]